MNQNIKKRLEIALAAKYKLTYNRYTDRWDSADSLHINDLPITRFPLKLGIINGNFDCTLNELTTLKGGPTEIYGSFDCSHNNLPNLIGGPTEIDINYNCSYNKLTTLEGSPNTILRHFYCHRNLLSNLIGGPKIVKGNFWCDNNQLTSLDGIPDDVDSVDCCNNAVPLKKPDGYRCRQFFT
jgi:hypothetical protein